MMNPNAGRLAELVPHEGRSNATRISAWIATGLFATLMTVSGVAYLAGPERVLEVMRELGYPPYFTTMLGIAKILGVVALLAPGVPTLREWAYAGFTFDLVAAVVSHLATGGASHVPQPILALVLLLVSYVLRQRAADALA